MKVKKKELKIKKYFIITIVALLLPLSAAISLPKYYGTGLCDKPGYKCITVKYGQSWKRLFPDKVQRDVVQRLNRTDTKLWSGRKLAIPENLESITALDISPFESSINTDEKVIIVDQDKLAWGAYNEQGNLVKWGPISSGKNYCRDINRSCLTVNGVYHIFSKKDHRCRSNSFPVGRGGSHMPYCMFFYRGYALHGSPYVVGHRGSHGCIRLFTQDAKWLNEKFVSTGDKKTGLGGTKVIIQALIDYENDKNKQKRNGR